MVNLTLTAGDDSLVIETNDIGWARCRLLAPQGNIFLGANVTKYVLGGLEFAVDKPEKLYQDEAWMNDILGYHLRNVLTLFEATPKHVLCVAEEDEHRLLICLADYVDGSGFTLTHILRLSPPDRRRWQEQLEGMREDLRAAGEKV